MTSNEHVWRALAAEFPDREVRSKPIGRGESARYITARQVMNRLDEVLGPENWTAEYTPFGAPGSVLCRLTVLLPDGVKAVKSDVGQPGDGDDDKSAVSDALKRAAVQLGVGRHLYGEGVPRHYGGGEAVPVEAQAAIEAPAPAPAREPASEPRRQGPPPATGRDLYRWAKDHDHLGFLAKLGKSRQYPGKILDWNPDQVADALHELHAKAPANGRRWG